MSDLAENKIVNNKDVVMMRFRSNCKLCRYSSYSNICAFAQGGQCPYQSFFEVLNGK